MNYATIKEHDTANGLGIRVSLFVSGCTHHCKECFNPEAWNFNYGNLFTTEQQDEIIKLLNRDYIKGLSLLGGEPMEKVNQAELIKLLRRVKKECPTKDIWCYSGYTFDVDLKPENGRAHCEVTDEMLSYIDVLVDGKFVVELKNLRLKFRGSSNQRVINVKESLKQNKVILLLE
mgnify:CR=1 FL=1|jgi:anaerobic ribonucleoside-triphosphate reductase activating protein